MLRIVVSVSRIPPESMDGILAIDKPRGWTSHDIVARLRRLTGQKRIGHAGTLDPMATGVLLLCLGEATRMSDALMGGAKWYLARVALGARTDTDDAEGQVVERGKVTHTGADLVAVLQTMLGTVQQVPPSYAAIKRAGVPAYRQARAGSPVELESRQITVHAYALLAHATWRPGTGDALEELPACDLLVCCSKGTYVRALARDVGEALGCTAHLAGLRRLASGAFTTRHCVSMRRLEDLAAGEGSPEIAALLTPLDAAVGSLPAVALGAERAARTRVGNLVYLPVPAGGIGDLRLYADDGALCALAIASTHPSTTLDSGVSAGFVTGQDSAWHPNRVLARLGSH